MATSQELKHRTKENDQAPQVAENMNNNNSKDRRQKKTAMAKRGLRSLAIAIATPFSLTLFYIIVLGRGHGYGTVSKPFWFPPLWALHLMCLVYALLMGLSAWLVWAEGGFHRKPMAAAMYLGQLGLSLAWDPIMFQMEASRIGLAVCLALLGSIVGCYRVFKEVNPIAGDLVKPCVVWAGFLSIVNLKLVYL